MIDPGIFVSANGLFTPLANGVILLLLLVLIWHEFARPRPPRSASRLGCLWSLLAVPLFAVFVIIVVIRLNQILQS